MDMDMLRRDSDQSKALKEVLYMKLRKTPKSVSIDITNRCNLRCKHCCYFSSSAETSLELPANEWLKFFVELGKYSVMEVVLQGGEPFIRKDIREIIQGIIDNKMRFSVLSNGTLIDEKLAAFLASTNRCNSVQISIDGSCASVHDSIRGPGSFAKAVQAIKHLKKHKIPVTSRVTIFKINVDDLENIARLLLEDLGLKSFSTNSISQLGLSNFNMDTVGLDIETRSRAMKILLALEEKYEKRITARAGPLVEAKAYIKMQQQLEKNERNKSSNLCVCRGVFDALAVRADGVITPCALLSHIELGRINKEDIKNLWQTHPELNNIRDRSKIKTEDFDFCKGCSYINYCGGFCPVGGYIEFGNINHPSTKGCRKRFVEAGGIIPAGS